MDIKISRAVRSSLAALVMLSSCSAQQQPKTDAKVIHLVDMSDVEAPTFLKECEEHCAQDEAALASALDDLMHAKMNSVDGQKVDLVATKQASKKLIAAFEPWFDKKKDSADPKEALGAYQLAPSIIGMAKFDDTEASARMHEKLMAGAPSLTTRFPYEPMAFYIHGQALQDKRSAPEVVIEDYKKCLELAPGESKCRKGYDEAVEDYKTPFCPTGGINHGLAFYLSSSKHDLEHPKRAASNENIFVEKSPRLSYLDVARTKMVRQNEKQLWSGDQVSIEFTSEGRKKLAVVTTSNVGGFMAIMLGDRVILNARINTPITEGSMSVTMGTQAQAGDKAQKLVEDMCKKSVTRELPPELKLRPRPPANSI